MGRTLGANQWLACSACGKRRRGRPLNSVVMQLRGAPKKHGAFRGGSGGAHEHDQTPPQLHVVCPTCAKRAVARHRGWTNPQRGEFEIRCPECLFRKSGVAYRDLPPLYYRVAARGSELWAWNREHLTQLLEILEAPSHRKNSLPIARLFVRREWLLRRKEMAKAIRRELLPAA